jgi:integrase
MSVRKRTWTTSKGEQREAWIVDYSDQQGERHIRTFDRKKEADAFHASVNVDVAAGIHTPLSKSMTVAEAGEAWLRKVEIDGRERSTQDQYRQHVTIHINPRLGREKLARLTTPRIEAFKDDLLAGVSRALAKKVLVSLKSMLREAQRTGGVAQNVALSVKINSDKRDAPKLRVGVDIPSPDEIKRLLAAADGKLRALLFTAVFTGLRASELRGLRWEDVDLKRAELHVRQRADCFNVIGSPKTHAGERTIPMGPSVTNVLREWKLACPKSEGGLVFPTGTGRVSHHANIIRALAPVMKAAGLVDKDGGPKYALHAFRHFFASWCINRKSDGGLELPIKVVQERLGHASIVMTSDRYGHLFPSSDYSAELAAAERALLA